jgi:hypothetical protein
MPLTSAVWDLNHTTAPEALLQPASQLTYAARPDAELCFKHCWEAPPELQHFHKSRCAY